MEKGLKPHNANIIVQFSMQRSFRDAMLSLCRSLSSMFSKLNLLLDFKWYLCFDFIVERQLLLLSPTTDDHDDSTTSSSHRRRHLYLRGCMVHRMQPLMEKASRYYIIFDFTLISYLCRLNVLSLFRLVFKTLTSKN